MLSARRTRLLTAAVCAAALGAVSFGIGFASAEPGDRTGSARTGRTPTVEHVGASTSSTPDPSSRPSATSTTGAPADAGSDAAGEGGVDGDDADALRACLQGMGLPVPEPGATITIEIIPVEGGPPTITVNGTVIEPSAALNAVLACRDELAGPGRQPSSLEDLLGDLERLDELPGLEEWLGGWDRWLPPGVDPAQLEQDLEQFRACLDAATRADPGAGPEATAAWAEALEQCAIALHD